MPNRNLYCTILAFLLISGVLSGCLNLGKGTERLPRLYVLTAITSDGATPPIDRKENLSIGVGPLAFPEYLNRPQIVTRASDNELSVAPFANWAEPLKQNVLRVMVGNIATLAETDAVYRYPWRVGYAPLVQLQAEIVQFDAARNGEAILAVRWEWMDQTGRPLMSRQHSVLRQPVQGAGDDAVVAAMNRLIYDYSRMTVEQLEAVR
jgi:uncharacterized lipoprotein YmbA